MLKKTVAICLLFSGLALAQTTTPSSGEQLEKDLRTKRDTLYAIEAALDNLDGVKIGSRHKELDNIRLVPDIQNLLAQLTNERPALENKVSRDKNLPSWVQSLYQTSIFRDNLKLYANKIKIEILNARLARAQTTSQK